MIARYDLRYELPGFDFFGWLVIAAARGATEIVFGTDFGKSVFTVETLRRRFESIIRPGPALLDLPSRIGDDGERLTFGPWTKFKLPRLVEFVKEGDTFPRLHSILLPRKERYTVTLRNYGKSPYRNSDESAWRTFAREIGAYVIEDYDVRPINLHERMALYAGAEMNFGVASGPMFLCTLTNYPCMSFDWGLGPQRQVLELSGIPAGSNLPWCGKNQFALWQPDDLPTIRRHFETWRHGLSR